MRAGGWRGADSGGTPEGQTRRKTEPAGLRLKGRWARTEGGSASGNELVWAERIRADPGFGPLGYSFNLAELHSFLARIGSIIFIKVIVIVV